MVYFLRKLNNNNNLNEIMSNANVMAKKKRHNNRVAAAAAIIINNSWQRKKKKYKKHGPHYIQLRVCIFIRFETTTRNLMTIRQYDKRSVDGERMAREKKSTIIHIQSPCFFFL